MLQTPLPHTDRQALQDSLNDALLLRSRLLLNHLAPAAPITTSPLVIKHIATAALNATFGLLLKHLVTAALSAPFRKNIKSQPRARRLLHQHATRLPALLVRHGHDLTPRFSVFEEQRGPLAVLGDFEVAFSLDRLLYQMAHEFVSCHVGWEEDGFVTGCDDGAAVGFASVVVAEQDDRGIDVLLTGSVTWLWCPSSFRNDV